MATLVISISLDSSEDSMGTPAGRVMLFESDPSEDPTSGHIPPLPAISPFLSSDDDTIDTPGQPIPHGRPYRYHPNGPVRMMTARKRVRPLHVQQLLVRHFVDHSSSDSSSRHSSLDHSSLDLQSTSAGPSRKRRRSPMTFVPALPLVFGALSPVRANLIPPHKRVRDIGYLADVEVDPRETRVKRVAHPAMPNDIPEPAQEGAAEVTYETLGDLVQRIVGIESAVTALTERVAELKRDNQRLRGTASVESQRVDRLLASMTHEEVEELIARRVAEEIKAREVVRNLEALNENEEEQEGENGRNGGNGNGDNGGNENGGNGGNGNEGNGNHGMHYGGFVPMARECTFQDFLKCKTHAFSGTEGVDGLMKLMTEVYCLRNEVQKMETELWNLTVKGNDLTAYNQRFQELILLCTRMVPDEEDRVERKLQGYAARSAENKKRMESNPRDN
nr:reverse transcriptase domain-containing protein [Tanacetum cinerariifolium]